MVLRGLSVPYHPSPQVPVLRWSAGTCAGARRGPSIHPHTKRRFTDGRCSGHTSQRTTSISRGQQTGDKTKPCVIQCEAAPPSAMLPTSDSGYGGREREKG